MNKLATGTLSRTPARNLAGGVPSAAGNVRIFAVPAGARSGASFITGLLAALLKSRGRTSVVELGSPYFYTALNMEKRFSERGFELFREQLRSGKRLGYPFNREEGVNWYLRAPSDRTPLRPDECIRLFSGLPGEYVIFDCSGLAESTLRYFAGEADVIFLVFDPLPSSLLSATAFSEELLCDERCVPVMNRMNRGVHKGELKRYLGNRKVISVPFVKPELIYRAEYDCVPVTELPEAREILMPSLRAFSQVKGLS